MTDDRDDLLSIAGWIYAARVTGSAANRPTGLARQCVNEARELIAEAGRKVEPAGDDEGDLSDKALDYLRLLVAGGPVVFRLGYSDERLELVKRGLAFHDPDGLWVTAKGRALVGEPEKVVTQPAGGVSLADLEESE